MKNYLWVVVLAATLGLLYPGRASAQRGGAYPRTTKPSQGGANRIMTMSRTGGPQIKMAGADQPAGRAGLAGEVPRESSSRLRSPTMSVITGNRQAPGLKFGGSGEEEGQQPADRQPDRLRRDPQAAPPGIKRSNVDDEGATNNRPVSRAPQPSPGGHFLKMPTYTGAGPARVD